MSQRASAGTEIEGKYRLEKELGSGGMGSVWLATQLMVDRNVAVKLLHPAFIDQDDLQARFEVEAKAIGRLNHPNCITLYDFGYSDELEAFYTVIEYIDGTSLDRKLGQSMAATEIADIIRQIALALDHAHHQGILHRDLKPENVMLAEMTDGSEIVKVLDFGIARIVKGDADVEQSEDSHRITKAGEVFGTPAYMSPEQARSIRQLQPTADLYSLGVIFYELVAGKLPFFANSAFDLLMLHVTKPVPPIKRLDVPDGLTDVIYRLLEKDPEKRYQSGKELVDALDELDLSEAEASAASPDDEPDDFAAGPTRVTPPPDTLEKMEAGAPDDRMSTAPTPTASDVSAEGRRATMVLDSDEPTGSDEWDAVEHTQLSRRRSYTVVGLAGAFLAIVLIAGFVVVLFLDDEGAADAVPRESNESAESSAPSLDETTASAAADTTAPPATDETEPSPTEMEFGAREETDDEESDTEGAPSPEESEEKQEAAERKRKAAERRARIERRRRAERRRKRRAREEKEEEDSTVVPKLSLDPDSEEENEEILKLGVD